MLFNRGKPSVEVSILPFSIGSGSVYQTTSLIRFGYPIHTRREQIVKCGFCPIEQIGEWILVQNSHITRWGLSHHLFLPPISWSGHE